MGCPVFSFDRIEGLLQRLPAYPPGVVAMELVLIGIVVYAIVRFVEGTRAAGVLKGLLVLVVVLGILSRLLDQGETFQRLSLLYDRFLALVAFSLVIIFQPELRRALVRLSEIPFIKSTPKDIAAIADDIAESCRYLARMKYGALIVIERQVAIGGVVEGGTVLNAELSAPLLQTIFYPGSALHDLAVVIKGKRVHSAGRAASPGRTGRHARCAPGLAPPGGGWPEQGVRRAGGGLSAKKPARSASPSEAIFPSP
jgi:diadenylate cyclase